MSARDRSALDSLPQPVFEADLEGRLVFANRAALAAFGYDESDLARRPSIEEMLAPEERARGRERLSALGRGEHLEATEYAAQRRDGTRFPVVVSSVPIVEEGRWVGTRGVLVDLTPLRAAESSLRIKDLALASALVGIAIAGTDGKITYVNPALVRLWGLSGPAEALGQPVERFWAGRDDTREVLSALVERGAWSGRLVARRRDGTRFDADVTAAMIPADDGRPLALVASVLDVTDRLRDSHDLAARTRQQKAVAAFGEAALASRDLDSLLNVGVVQIAHVLDVEMAEVLELQPDGGSLRLRAGIGWRPGLVGVARVPTESSPAGDTLRAKAPVVVEDLAAETRFGAAPLHLDHGVASGMGVAIGSASRTWGVLGVHSRQRRSFSRDDAIFLQSVANVIAAAIGRHEAERALEHRLELETQLALVSGDLMRAPPDAIDDAIAAALQRVGRTAGVDRCHLFQRSAGRDRMSRTHEWCAEGVTGWSGALQDLAPSRFAWSMSRLERLEAVLVPDVGRLPPEAAAEREEFAREQTASVLLVPVASGGALQGFVGFDSVRSRSVWPDEDVRILRMLAELVGAALDRRRQMLALRDSERRFRGLLEDLDQAAVMLDAAGRLVFCNDCFLRLVGWTRDEALGVDWVETFLPAGDREGIRRLFGDGASAGERPRRFESAILTRAGDRRRMVWNDTLLRDSTGTVVGRASLGEDVTARRQAEEQLALQASLLDAANDAIYLFELDGRILYANDAATRVDGYSREELLGMRISDLDDAATAASVDRRVALLLEQGEAVFQVRHRRKDGEIVPVEAQARVVDVQGTRRILAVNRDLRERRRAEAALRESEHKLKMLIESSDDIIVVQDLAGRYTYYNARPQYGVRSEDLIGRTPFEVHDQETASEIVRRVETVARTGRSVTAETRLQWGGRALWFSDVTYPIHDDQGTVTAVATISRNVTERRAREEELRKLSAAIEQSPVAVLITDAAGTIEYVNPRFTEMTGYTLEEARGARPSLVKSPNTPLAVHRDMWRTVLDGRVWRGEVENRRKNGEPFWSGLTIAPLRGENGELNHLLGIQEDVTERRQLEQHLQNAQRLEAVGTLAGGIAHDFNNILAIILGHAALLERRREQPERFADSLRVVTDAVERGRRLVAAILAFARRGDGRLEGVDLNEEVVGTLALLEETFPKAIELRTDLQRGLPRVMADASEFQQVIVNLCVNARDAVVEAGGVGVISVRTRSVEGSALRARVPEAGGGSYVELTVADDGVGMPPHVLRRVFEPFFTTKLKGRGTGLGLAVVYGVVKRLRGFTHVESAPGRGTRFSVYVPLAPGESRPVDAAPVVAAGATDGHETILLVEDEDALRELVRNALDAKGYRVLVAADGEEALRVFDQAPSEISLVVSDLGLPRRSGREVVRLLKDRRPGLKAILATGHLEPESPESGADDLVEGVLLKPFPVGDLLATVRRVLDAR